MRQRIYHVLEDAESDNKVSQIYNRFMLVCIVASMIPLCFKQTKEYSRQTECRLP